MSHSRLYDLARNDARQKDAREQAVFWLSQQEDDVQSACSKHSQKLPRAKIRDKAIFGLSQHRSGKGFPILRQYAENRNAPTDLRGKAIFWLGQRKGDGRRFNYLRALYSRLESDDLKDKVIFAMSQQKDEREHEVARRSCFEFRRAYRDAEESALLGRADQQHARRASCRCTIACSEREMKEQMIFVLSQRRDRRRSTS